MAVVVTFNPLALRRSVMLGAKSAAIDTTAAIDQYGYALGRSNTGTFEDEGWAYTVFYDVDSIAEFTRGHLVGNITGNGDHTFQYEMSNGSANWDYFPNRTSVDKRITRIRFSILQSEIESGYVYVQETGQILFAGPQSIYYGHRNISEVSA